MAQDTKAAKALKIMDRTTASYKLRHGLAAFCEDGLLAELRECPFSLNIDEATSKTNMKVLSVLVNHFSPSSNRVLTHLSVLPKSLQKLFFLS